MFQSEITKSSPAQAESHRASSAVDVRIAELLTAGCARSGASSENRPRQNLHCLSILIPSSQFRGERPPVDFRYTRCTRSPIARGVPSPAGSFPIEARPRRPPAPIARAHANTTQLASSSRECIAPAFSCLTNPAAPRAPMPVRSRRPRSCPRAARPSEQHIDRRTCRSPALSDRCRL